MDIVVNDRGIPVITLTLLSQMPRSVYQEYAGDLEEACKYHLAKFHKLPEQVYQYQHRYFFPLNEEAE